MVTQINELRVIMDTSSYEAGTKTIVTASAQAEAAQKSLTATVQDSSVKISQAGDWVEKLKRKYVDGYASAQMFAREIDNISRAVDIGRLKGAELSSALDGVIRKYGMTADVTQMVTKSQIELAHAAELANQRFLQQKNISPANGNAVITNRSSVSSSVNQFNTANIAAQFQDIAITSAMGMNPLQIALQQGMQLSAVMGPMGAAGAVRSLGAAFASLVNPVSLLTIGFVAAGAAAIQYFTSAESGSQKSASFLEKQNDAIRAAAQAWGTAAPALQAYVDQMERAKNIELGRTAYDTLASREFDGLSEKMAGLGQQFSAALRSMGQVQASPAAISEFRDTFADLQRKLSDGTATIFDVQRAERLLADTLQSTGTKEVRTFATEFDKITASLDRAAESAARTRQEFISLVAGGTSVQDIVENNRVTIGDRTYPASAFIPRNPGVPTARPNDLESEMEASGKGNVIVPELPKVGSLSDSVAASQSNIVAQIQARQQLFQTQQTQLEQLQLEAQLIGSTASERARATAALQAEQQLRQQGINILSQEGQAYRDNAVAMAEARVQIERSQAAYASYQQAGSSAIDALTASTGTLQDRLKNAANAMLSWVTQMALANPLKNAMFGTNLPTLADLGKPQVPAGLTPTSTASMMVTAGTVMINGGVMGGQFPSIPGAVPGATTTNGTLSSVLGIPANTNGVRPDLMPGGLVNSPVPLAADPTTRALMYRQAISQIESGSYSGNYSAIGPMTRTGDQAYGRYQVMGANIPSWTQQHYGQRLTPSQYLANPSAQDAVFDGEFGSYVSKYGEGPAATKWFTGSHIARGASDINGTTDYKYASQFNSNMQKLSQTTSVASKDIGTLGDTSSKVGTQITDSLGKLATPAATPAVPAVAPATTTASGGNIFSSLFGGIFKLFGFADGTPFSPGGVAMVGERGPEIVNLPRGSQVIPNHRMGDAMGAAGGTRSSGGRMKVDVGVSVDKNGNLEAWVRNISDTSAANATRAGFAAYDEVLPSRIEAYRMNPDNRGGLAA